MQNDLTHYPILPLKDLVIFPKMMTVLYVGRKNSIEAIERAQHGDQKIILLTQKQANLNFPKATDVYQQGVLANLSQVTHLQDKTTKVLLEGISRVQVHDIENQLTGARVEWLEEIDIPENEQKQSYRQLIFELLKEYDTLRHKTDKEQKLPLDSILETENMSYLCDWVSSLLPLSVKKKIEILQELNLEKRALLLMKAIQSEISVFELERKLKERVKTQVDKNQKEYYLNEQAKAIQKELEELDEGKHEAGLLKKAIQKAKMPETVEEKAFKELDKLKKLSSMSSEAGVIRNYLETLISYPWQKSTEIIQTIGQAQTSLNQSHYGLADVKQRIVEYLAIQQRRSGKGGQILCLVGPPGVGKTSIVKSIAEATQRHFVKLSLGGLRDESEIRGHRRTYIGAMPGRIVQSLIKSKINNPLFLLDEIDKMGMDYRGDPASAMLEVLDPEQNSSFNDHFMEVDIDLSQVMFIATANTLNIPKPLLDRMEIIRLPGYTEGEKLQIAKTYLWQSNQEKTGLQSDELSISEVVLKKIIEDYTREAGVRELDRQLHKICRKSLLILELDQKDSLEINAENLKTYLGAEKYQHDKTKPQGIGQITGLAYTEVGGELLTIEAVILPGKGEFKQTGQLGEVMRESLQAALTVAKKAAYQQGIAQAFFSEHDFHLHLPQGAIKKDGPSAGAAMACALFSAMMQEKPQTQIAMTGEISLQGRILPIGGLKEKLYAAVREKIKTVILPRENGKDLDEIPGEIKDKINCVQVEHIEEIWRLLFPNIMNNNNKIIKNPINIANYLPEQGHNMTQHQ